FDETHPWAKQFKIICYQDGFHSSIPHGFFQDWLGEESDTGTFYISKASGFGVGSIVKYDAGIQSLRVGRFVAGGLRLKFLLNGQHDMTTISTSMFSVFGGGLTNTSPPQYSDSIIKNDVWIGDEVMMLGGGIIENGCVIGARALLPPNFRSEPYGIYAGSPAKLIRFRFSEKIREALIDLAWWDTPDLFAWLQETKDFYLADLTADEGKSLAMLAKLKEKRNRWIRDREKKSA
ncbi:hypothetical protein J5224_30350, partial [Candidatus Symbiopectobacterium sp. NZEC135]|nr:hypothetical protein [Candidatus Symbiopectobacterium sp. NZEC135]